MNVKPASLLLPTLALLAGCGGRLDRPIATAANPFAGTYAGTYDATFIGDSGTFNPIVSSNGALSGTSHSNGANADGTIKGQISNDGKVQATIQYPGAPVSSLSGSLTRGTDGTLSGTLTQTLGNASGDVTISVRPVP